MAWIYNKARRYICIIERGSPGPYLELFARFARKGWDHWGNEDVEQNSLRDKALRKGHVPETAELLLFSEEA